MDMGNVGRENALAEAGDQKVVACADEEGCQDYEGR